MFPTLLVLQEADWQKQNNSEVNLSLIQFTILCEAGSYFPLVNGGI